MFRQFMHPDVLTSESADVKKAMLEMQMSNVPAEIQDYIRGIFADWAANELDVKGRLLEHVDELLVKRDWEIEL